MKNIFKIVRICPVKDHWAIEYINSSAEQEIIPPGAWEDRTMPSDATWLNKTGDHWARKYVDYVKGTRKVHLFEDDDDNLEKIGDVYRLPDDDLNTEIKRQFAFSVAWEIIAKSRKTNFIYSDTKYRDDEDFEFDDKNDVSAVNREGVYQ